MPSRPARSRHQSIAPCSTIQRSSTPCPRIFRSSASANRARSPTLSLSSPHPKLITSPELPCLSTVACFGIITSSSRSAVLLVAFLSPTEKCRRLRIVKELVEGAVVKDPAFGADVVALRDREKLDRCRARRSQRAGNHIAGRTREASRSKFRVPRSRRRSLPASEPLPARGAQLIFADSAAPSEFKQCF